MGSPLLEVNPRATFLLDLVAQDASGRLLIGDRGLVLEAGLVVDILPAARDESFDHFIIESGRVSANDLARHVGNESVDEQPDLGALLVQHGALTANELTNLYRSVWLERLTRALRDAGEREEPLPTLSLSEGKRSHSARHPLLPLVLDALTRLAAASEAAVVGGNLNHRIEWLPGAHREAARAWANLGDAPDRPAVSTVLVKRPAAAPRIAALVRAGIVRLAQPGRPIFSTPPEADTLPPPAPRLIALGEATTDRAPSVDPLRQAPPRPRMGLEPGLAVVRAEPLQATHLPAFERPSLVLDDPLTEIEKRIALLEGSGAPGAERARAFCALADVWQVRFHSAERACLAFREAAAADPKDTVLLQQAALHCHALGQQDLAARYAVGAVATARLAVERAPALRLRATVQRAAGNIDECIEALCEAAADDPGNPEPHQHVAALLVERGDLEGANAHARLAATSLQDDAPHQAMALLAWAMSLKPKDVATAYEYASLLDASGHPLAAAALFGETATHAPSMQLRLRTAAAHRAHAAQRDDIAVEYLIDAFDAWPASEEISQQLFPHLQTIAPAEYRAALCEDVAVACPMPERGRWLLAAGQALIDAEGQHEAGIWLLFEALLTDPTTPEPLAALRAHAQAARELTLLAHALRAAIGVTMASDPQLASELLRELGVLAEQRLDNGHLALAAWVQLQRLPGPADVDVAATVTRLGAWAEARRTELDLAEQALANATNEERAACSRRVALLLPNLPEFWERMIALLSVALAGNIEVDDTRALLETLYGLRRNPVDLATFLEDQAEAVSSAERVRILLRLAAVHAVREDAAGVAAVCETVLAAEPTCRAAIAKLLRATRRIGDPKRLANALALQLAVTPTGRTRARVLAQLARAEEQSGALANCAEHAATALCEDGDSVDAGPVLLRHVHRIDTDLASTALGALAKGTASTRALESSRVHVAAVAGDQQLMRAALARWIGILPADGTAHRTHVLALAEGDDGTLLLEVTEAALATIPVPEVLDAARTALERLQALGCLSHAARLALGIAQHQGKADPALAHLAVRLAREGGDPAIIGRALEHLAAASAERDRSIALLALAEHHRAQQDSVAEVRSLLRNLECPGDHVECLERLHALFKQTGDAIRLEAVIERMLQVEHDLGRRRPLLLELAAVAVHLHRNRERAEFHVRGLIAEDMIDLAGVRAALGVLLSLGDLPWALERAQAIAEACPSTLAAHIYLWCSTTAEQTMNDQRLALDIAKRGALKCPSSGELLLVVERLTLNAGDTAAAVDTYNALIGAAIGPHGRRALLYRAGRWLERADQLEQALDRYLAAFDLAPSAGAAFTALLRVAGKTGNMERIVPCYELLATVTRDDTARLRLLCKASELCVEELGQHKRAFDLLLRANTFSEGFELDDRLSVAAQMLRVSDPPAGLEATQSLVQELEQRVDRFFAASDKARCLLRLAALYSNGAADHDRARTHLDTIVALGASDELPTEVLADAGTLRASLPEIAPLPTPQSAPAPQPPPLPQSSLRVKKETANPFDRLKREVLAQPWRTEALRSLAMLCTASAQPAEHHVLAQLLATFDPSISAPDEAEFHSGLWRSGALREAAGEAQPSSVTRFLSILWEHARVIPRFRRPLSSFGVDERDRITRITIGPVAEAYAQAVRVLGMTDVQVYISLGNGAAARVIPTHPASVLAGRGVALPQGTLLYMMARAMWLTQPEHVIGGVLNSQEASDLLEGAAAAFGTGSGIARATASAKELAGLLLHSVPTREQHHLAEALREDGEGLTYAAVHAQTASATARAALLTAGGVRTAIRVLAATEIELAGLDLTHEPDFARGCEQSPALAATVRCALSEPYLSRLTCVI